MPRNVCLSRFMIITLANLEDGVLALDLARALVHEDLRGKLVNFLLFGSDLF